MSKEIFVAFGVDVDAVGGWLGSYGGEDSPGDISRGVFAGETGMLLAVTGTLLALVQRHGTQRTAEVCFRTFRRQQLELVFARQQQPAALRILVKNPGSATPQYDMALEPADMIRHGDVVIDSDGLRVLVDADSLAAVDGATVDFRDDPLQPG